MSQKPFTWWEVGCILLMLAMLVLCFVGCGAKREESHHQERQEQTTAKTTTTVERAGNDAAGHAYAETVKTVAFTEQVAKSQADAQIVSVTTIQAPEAAALFKAAVSVAGAAIPVPGIGGLISGVMGWFTGTPDGAATGIALSTMLAASGVKMKRDHSDSRRAKRHLATVVKGNSDFMQAHPDQAEKLKTAQRSAQADPDLKSTIQQIRATNGLI